MDILKFITLLLITILFFFVGAYGYVEQIKWLNAYGMGLSIVSSFYLGKVSYV